MFSLEKRGGPRIGSGWRSSLPSESLPLLTMLFILLSLDFKSDWALQKQRPTNDRLHLHSSPSLPGDNVNPRMSLLLQRKLTLFDIKGEDGNH